MESNRKLRGLTKAKMQAVRALYRAAPSSKPSSTTTTTKLKPSPAPRDNNGGINGDQMKHMMMMRSNGQNINPSTIVKHDRVFPQQPQKVTINVVTDQDSYTNKFDHFYGAVPVDDAIDSKAANYISRVQASFNKLEQMQ